MGKATIKSGGAAGLYSIDLDKNIATIQARSAELQAQITSLITQITAAETALSTAKSDLDSEKADLDALIDALNDLLDNPQSCIQCTPDECTACTSPPGTWRFGIWPCSYTSKTQCEEANPNWKYGVLGSCSYPNQAACEAASDPAEKQKEIIAQSKAVTEKAATYRAVESILRRLKATKLALEQLQAKHDAQAAIETRNDIWCADLTEDLTGTVATVRIPGIAEHVLIRPGYSGRATYSDSRDGLINPSLAGGAEGLYWNWAMRPAWERWRPTYRGATLSALSGDTCTVTLDETKSADQDLNVNPQSVYTGVAIEYMDCDGEAFANGNHVLVEFVGQDKTTPKVIGFYDNPRPCLTSEFICVPVAQEATTGWGEPFESGGTPINPPLGTVGGAYAESIVRASSTQAYEHQRAGDDYDGRYTQQLLRTTTHGFYDWHGDEYGETLTINSVDGNRYWGRRTVRDTEIFYKGALHCSTYNSQLVIGIGLATWSSTKYLYAVFLKPDGADAIDEIFQVWRRVWQTSVYANDNLYHVTTEPLGWELLGEIPAPDYVSVLPASGTGVFDIGDISSTDSGQIGGAHFSPDGKKVLLVYSCIDAVTEAYQWFAGYQECVISGTGSTLTNTMTWNPQEQSAGWDYAIAWDYDRSGSIVSLFAELEYAAETANRHKRFSLKISGSGYAVTLLHRKFYNTAPSEGYQLYWYNLDLRFASGCGQYYVFDDGASNEEYGFFTLDNEIFVTTKSTGDTITHPTPSGGFADIGYHYALMHEDFGFGLPTLNDRGFNFAAHDFHGNMLASVTGDWTAIEATFYIGTGAPAASSPYNYFSGEPSVEVFFSIDSYTDPALVYLSVI